MKFRQFLGMAALSLLLLTGTTLTQTQAAPSGESPIANQGPEVWVRTNEQVATGINAKQKTAILPAKLKGYWQRVGTNFSNTITLENIAMTETDGSFTAVYTLYSKESMADCASMIGGTAAGKISEDGSTLRFKAEKGSCVKSYSFKRGTAGHTFELTSRDGSIFMYLDPE